MSENTELTTTKPAAEGQLITITADTVKKFREESLSLVKLAGTEIENGKIKVVDADAMFADKEGLAKVIEIRKKAVKTRTTCEKEHKIIKENAKRECDRIDESRRTLVAIIEEVENRAKAIEQAVEDEEKAILTRRLDARQKERESRIEVVGGIAPFIRQTMQSNFIRVAEDPQFEEWLSGVKIANEHLAAQEKERKAAEEWKREENARLDAAKAESDRLAKIEADRVAEQNRQIAADLAEQKRQLDQQAAEQKSAQDKIDAEKKAIADAEAEKQRLADKERADAEKRAKEESENANRRSWMFDAPAKRESTKRERLESILAVYFPIHEGQHKEAADKIEEIYL